MGAAGVLIASSLMFSNEAIEAQSAISPDLAAGKTVIYFTAGNCKSCRKFEDDGAEKAFQEKVEAKGIRYVRKSADDRVHLKHKNIYDDYTPTFRQASDMAGYVTVPTFAYVVDGEVVAADFGSTKSVIDALSN